jgi:Holliday junction resolvasome RuvABC ATP-dependent DNA helicase subunit
MITTMFNKLIGQEEVKRTLSFFAKAQNKNGVAPFLMMSGAKGLGKTEFAKEYASNLKNKDRSKRPFPLRSTAPLLRTLTLSSSKSSCLS